MTIKTTIAANGEKRTRVAGIGRLKLGTAAILLLLAVTGGPALGLLATGSGPASDTTSNMVHAEDNNDVTVEIDCNTSQVRVTAPVDDDYGLTVVETSRLGADTSTSRQTPLSGNTTVEVNEAEVVYAYVTDASTGEPITTAVTQCEELPETAATNETDGPSIAIDCDENAVRFTAPEDVSYTARVSSVDVSPTGASTGSMSRTAEGNTTISANGELVMASLDAGDGPVSAIRDCSRIDGYDDLSTDERSCSRDTGNS